MTKEDRISSITSFISVGESNAIHQRELMGLLGWSQQMVKDAVQEARREGYRILSGGSGYWFAESEADFEQWAEYVTLSCKSLYTTLSIMRSTEPPKR